VKRFSEIMGAYTAVDRWLEEQLAEAAAQNQPRREKGLQSRQAMNDHAYFVLLFGQFEIAVNEACIRAIKSRQAATNWLRRRGWDILRPDDRRLGGLSFEDRVALVLDRRTEDYRQVKRYYDIRNMAAHGKFQGDYLDIGRVAADLQTLFGRLSA